MKSSKKNDKGNLLSKVGSRVMEIQNGFGEIKKSWVPIQNPSHIIVEHQMCYLAYLALSFIIYEIGIVISHQKLWSEKPGARPLHEAPCEQVKFDKAQRKKKNLSQNCDYFQGNWFTLWNTAFGAKQERSRRYLSSLSLEMDQTEKQAVLVHLRVTSGNSKYIFPNPSSRSKPLWWRWWSGRTLDSPPLMSTPKNTTYC